MDDMKLREYTLRDFMSSCNQDIADLRGRIYDKQRALADLDHVSAKDRIFHGARIKERRRSLETQIEEMNANLEALLKELEKYERYGLEFYRTGPGKEDKTQVERMNNRENKMQIVEMIDLGMM